MNMSRRARAARLQMHAGSHFVHVRILLSSLLRPLELGVIDMCRWYKYPLWKTPCQVEREYFSLFPSRETSHLKAGKEKEILIKQLMPGNPLQSPPNLICLWVICKCNFYLFVGRFSREINGRKP